MVLEGSGCCGAFGVHAWNGVVLILVRVFNCYSNYYATRGEDE